MKVTVYGTAPDGTPQVDRFEYPKLISKLSEYGLATVECHNDKGEREKFWTSNRAWKMIVE